MEGKKEQKDRKKKSKKEKQKQKKEEKKKEIAEESMKNQEDLDALLELVERIHVSEVALNNTLRFLNRVADKAKVEKFQAISCCQKEELEIIKKNLAQNIATRAEKRNSVDLPQISSILKPPESSLSLPGASSSSSSAPPPAMEFAKDISIKERYRGSGFQFGTFKSQEKRGYHQKHRQLQLGIQKQDHSRLGIQSAEEGGDHEQADVAREIDDERSTADEETALLDETEDEEAAGNEQEDSNLPSSSTISADVLTMLEEFGTLMIQESKERTENIGDSVAEHVRRRRLRAEALKQHLDQYFKNKK